MSILSDTWATRAFLGFGIKEEGYHPMCGMRTDSTSCIRYVLMTPESLLQPGLYKRLLRQSFLVPLLLSAVVSALLTWNIVNLLEMARSVDRADQVRAEIIALEKSILDAETSIRGFRAYGDKEFLEPYESSMEETPRHFSNLKALIRGNPVQESHLQKLDESWSRALVGLQELIAVVEKHTPALTSRGLRSKRDMDEIRELVRTFLAREDQFRFEQNDKVQSKSRLLIGLAIGMSIILVLVLGYFTRNAIGSLSGAYVSVMTKLENRARELYESREWFSTTLSSIGDAVIVVDVQSRVVFMNKIAEDLTGWDFENAEDKPMGEVFNIINEKTRQPAFNPVGRVLAEGVIVGLANHTVLISADDKEWPIEDSAAPVHDLNGEVRGVVLVFRDVTDKHISTRELENLADRLQTALQHRDDFLSVASHELKTPLTSLRLQLQLAKRQVMSLAEQSIAVGTAQKILNQTDGQISRLIKLVDDLLDVSVISAGKLRYEFKMIDLNVMLKDVMERFSIQFTSVPVSLELNVAGPLFVRGDLFRLEQVVVNLLTNALKYGANKPVNVTLEARNGTALLKVQDHGIGIPKDKQLLIFERFERALNFAHISGLGLGLFIAKKIIQDHEGTIRVESEPGQGSTFTVELLLDHHADA